MKRSRLKITGVVCALALGALQGTASAQSAAPPALRAAERTVGEWSIVETSGGVYRIEWTSPRRLPITSARPTITFDGRVLGVPTVSANGRTVRVEVLAGVRPDPTHLDVILSGDRLDVAGRDGKPQPASARRAPLAPDLGADPATPGPHAVVSSDYELPGIKLAGMAQPIEMVGHVVEPAPAAATGPRPLVFFLHGRHSYCYTTAGGDGFDWPCVAPFKEIPSHLGYDYIQQVLASQGYATVSVRVNGINAQDFRLEDGGADARARIVRAHLDHWVGLAATHQVDLSRVVLVGHSRGGEGVDRAALQIPLSAPYRIVGQLLLAPTNFGSQTAAYVPTVTVLPYCDGDVIDLQGQKFTDVARDLTFDDTSLKSSVLVMGANHNFFNTEWTPGVAVAPAWDDWFGPATAECGESTPTRLTAAEQRTVGVAYVAGAVRLFAGGEEEFLPMYDGSRVSVASTGDADVRGHAIGGGRALRKPGKGAGLSLPDGAQTQLCSGVVSFDGPSTICGRGGVVVWQTPHWADSGELRPRAREFEMSWDAVGQTGGLAFADPLTLTDRRLELRTIVDPELGDVDLRVRLTDADGAHADLVPVGGGVLPGLPLGDGLGKRWAQTLIVDPATAAGIDLARVVQVDLVSANAEGRVWVLDVAAAPATLAGVPNKRLALLSLGRLRTLEGDGPGQVTARVPFTIAGSLAPGAEAVVGVVTGDPRVRPYKLKLDLAPGQTQGVVKVDYEADQADDFPRAMVSLMAWAKRGVMADVYAGGLVILDDDPTPKVTLSRAQERIREGDPAIWRARSVGESDVARLFVGRVVAGPGRDLTVGDVPRSWLRERIGRVPAASKPLYRVRLTLYVELGRSGKAELVVPTRSDGAREGVESITMQLRVFGTKTKATQTIRIAG